MNDTTRAPSRTGSQRPLATVSALTTYRRLLGYLKPHRGRFILGMLESVGLTVLHAYGDITYLVQRDYSMRLWLDPQKLAVRNLTANDVISAVNAQNAQVAAGQIGQPPVPNGQVFQYTMSTLGRLAEDQQFDEMILRSDASGRIIRIRDVAHSELGALGYDQGCTLDGKPSVALSVYQLPGSNALETAQSVKQKMEELKIRFPAGLDYSIVYDTTPFIEESVDEVLRSEILQSH